MTLPSLLLALLIALLIGALFHVVRGGSGWRLLLYFGLSILGFALGQTVGLWFGVLLFKLGGLEIGLGLAGSLLILLVGEWLSRIKPTDKSGV